MRRLIVGIYVVWVILLSSLLSQASDKLQIRIWTDKDQFLVHEPIIVYYELKNISDSILVMSFGDLEEDFKIKDQEGRDYFPLLRAWRPPSDTLTPGEIHQNMLDVGDLYGIEKVSEYTCYMQTQPYGAYSLAWTKSNTIKFKIVEPTGKEKEALRMFAEAESLTWTEDTKKRELAFSKYLQVAEKYPRSVYAPVSLLAASEICRNSADLKQISKNVLVYTKLIENYPDPYYFDLAFTRLIETYAQLKDKSCAIQTMRELIERNPNTKISERAEYWLERIQQWEFE